jgi:hypothetical protein
MFKMEGAFFTNWQNGKVMDISGGVDTENRDIIMYNKHGKINQQWDIVYADQWKGEPGKGELNEDFGLYVQRDFYIVSRLPKSRYLDLVSNKMVIKIPNGLKTQVWYFDQSTLTIKSKSTNKSWDITSSGRNKEMQVYSTNSRWW